MQYVFVFVLGIAAGMYFWPSKEKAQEPVKQVQSTSPGQKIDQILNIIKE